MHLLLWFELAIGREGAGDVAGIAVVLATHIK